MHGRRSDDQGFGVVVYLLFIIWAIVVTAIVRRTSWPLSIHWSRDRVYISRNEPTKFETVLGNMDGVFWKNITVLNRTPNVEKFFATDDVSQVGRAYFRELSLCVTLWRGRDSSCSERGVVLCENVVRGKPPIRQELYRNQRNRSACRSTSGIFPEYINPKMFYAVVVHQWRNMWAARKEKGALNANDSHVVYLVGPIHCAPLERCDNCIGSCCKENHKLKNQRHFLVNSEVTPLVPEPIPSRWKIHWLRIVSGVVAIVCSSALVFVGLLAFVAGSERRIICWRSVIGFVVIYHRIG